MAGKAGKAIYATARWQAVRLVAMHRDGWQCRQCSRKTALQVHHVEPIAAGGAAYDLGNLETVCRDCHYGRHRKVTDPETLAWTAFVEDCCHAS